MWLWDKMCPHLSFQRDNCLLVLTFINHFDQILKLAVYYSFFFTYSEMNSLRYTVMCALRNAYSSITTFIIKIQNYSITSTIPSHCSFVVNPVCCPQPLEPGSIFFFVPTIFPIQDSLVNEIMWNVTFESGFFHSHNAVEIHPCCCVINSLSLLYW